MTTVQAQQGHPASAADLLHLLATNGVPDEAIGAGIKASLDTLDYSESWYELPSYLDEHLATVRLHLGLALAALEQGRRLVKSRYD